MALTVSSMAGSSRLTTAARVQAELGISSDTALIETLVDQASAGVVSHCNRQFARATYTETLPGFGDVNLQLARTPIVSVASVVDRYAAIITDYSIRDREIGWLFRRCGWAWTVMVSPGLVGGGSWMDRGNPLARQEDDFYSVAYTAGYILPSAYLVGVTTLSVDATDDSFNDSANAFPTNLVAGDVVESGSFSNAVNNGRFIVTGTPTAGKILVSAALTTEAAGSARTLKFRPHADCRRNLDDVEKACIEAVKSWYLRRTDDGAVVEKQAGPMRVRYNENPGETAALPPACLGLLSQWVRRA